MCYDHNYTVFPAHLSPVFTFRQNVGQLVKDGTPIPIRILMVSVSISRSTLTVFDSTESTR